MRVAEQFLENFPERSNDLIYSPYSLRHTFATFALAEGMTGDHVAEMMGTSVKMLNSHYKHGTIEQTRRYLEERGLLNTGGTASAHRKSSLAIMPGSAWDEWQGTRLKLSAGGSLVVTRTPE